MSLSRILYILASLCAFATLNAESSLDASQNNNGAFIGGAFELYNKKAIKQNATIPNNTYSYALGQINLGYKVDNLTLSIGGVMAGLSSDSTKGYSYNHIGFFPGYYNQRGATADNAHNAFIHNAFLQYQNAHVDITLGRFKQENDDWLDLFVEGVNAKFMFNDVFVRIFGTSGMALVGNGWLMDYNRLFAENGAYSAEFGVDSTHILASAYIYHAPKEYTAPGFNVVLNFGADSTMSYKTKLTAIFPIHNKGIMDIGKHYFANIDMSANGEIKDISGFSASMLLRQDIIYNNAHSIAFGVYKNIGNANARVGQAGNPIGLNFLDNSVYATGPALNAALAPDAISGLIFSNASFYNLAKLIKALSIGVDFRYTSAPSAVEHSIKGHLDWSINDNLALNLIAAYYIHIMKDSGFLGITPDGFSQNRGESVRLNRSYITTLLTYSF